MDNVIFEKKQHTALITINKPHTLNALCESLISQINTALDTAENDPEIYTVIITGSGKTFIAGADIKEMYRKNETEIAVWAALGSDLNMRLENMDLPVIAAINGYALGGGLELALACDIRIASENARMGLPETSLGVICGAGGTQRLPRTVGESIAKEMIFTAEIIDAQKALNIRLINKITSKENLLNEAISLCRAIEKNGQIAVKSAKEAVNISRNSSIQGGCLIERKIFSKLFSTDDQKIGMGGFLAKEKNIKFKNK
ncbi:enoyl-CoA hydratase/isomerase family protein [Mogibacterium sp. NSJ-24]|jgi:enoyl-CoA hydratase|uniref:short-chain-enoyl-CoA hydratase n=1 Tax=Lentihominibacter hominis TaxID=2763645 RepID=A0A926EBI6_9FIRM|nr:enoyl-CoA hydratase-related protein [Lentihominibacter hominis]MBC8568752.1 enoyl-CoA hydratase/isomerase family protein [Lentihominibacter hominis]